MLGRSPGKTWEKSICEDPHWPIAQKSESWQELCDRGACRDNWYKGAEESDLGRPESTFLNQWPWDCMLWGGHSNKSKGHGLHEATQGWGDCVRGQPWPVRRNPSLCSDNRICLPGKTGGLMEWAESRGSSMFNFLKGLSLLSSVHGSLFSTN